MNYHRPWFTILLSLILLVSGVEVPRSQLTSAYRTPLPDDCRRRRKPLKDGEFQLDGIWLDHRNNHKVRIQQNGSNLNQTAYLKATYVDRLKCPDPNGDLQEDFYGDLQNTKLKGEILLCGHATENGMPRYCKRKVAAELGGSDGTLLSGDPSRVTCKVDYYVCGSLYHRTKVVNNGSGECETFVKSEQAKIQKEEFCCDCYPKCVSDEPGVYKHPPKLDLTVAADGKSMTGTYLNPYTNQQETIYLTLEKSIPPGGPGGGDAREQYDDDWVTYYPNTVIYAKSSTKIYSEPSSTSSVKMTVPIGTSMVMEHVILGADGNPAWYFVTDHSSPFGTKWFGYIPAPMVRCPSADSSRPAG